MASRARLARVPPSRAIVAAAYFDAVTIDGPSGRVDLQGLLRE